MCEPVDHRDIPNRFRSQLQILTNAFPLAPSLPPSLPRLFLHHCNFLFISLSALRNPAGLSLALPINLCYKTPGKEGGTKKSYFTASLLLKNASENSFSIEGFSWNNGQEISSSQDTRGEEIEILQCSGLMS